MCRTRFKGLGCSSDQNRPQPPPSVNVSSDLGIYLHDCFAHLPARMGMVSNSLRVTHPAQGLVLLVKGRAALRFGDSLGVPDFPGEFIAPEGAPSFSSGPCRVRQASL